MGGIVALSLVLLMIGIIWIKRGMGRNAASA